MSPSPATSDFGVGMNGETARLETRATPDVATFATFVVPFVVPSSARGDCIYLCAAEVLFPDNFLFAL